MVVTNALQSIVCTNNTPEIFDISYTFDPSNAVVRRTEDYILSYKYEIKFFLSSSAMLTIGGLDRNSHNDANYTLVINIQVDGGTQQYLYQCPM
jgi:hypothetical protein